MYSFELLHAGPKRLNCGSLGKYPKDVVWAESERLIEEAHKDDDFNELYNSLAKQIAMSGMVPVDYIMSGKDKEYLEETMSKKEEKWEPTIEEYIWCCGDWLNNDNGLINKRVYPQDLCKMADNIKEFKEWVEMNDLKKGEPVPLECVPGYKEKKYDPYGLKEESRKNIKRMTEWD